MTTNAWLAVKLVARALVVAVAMGVLAMPGPALAGSLINATFLGGTAIEGHDPVAYFTEGMPVEGSSAHTYQWKGATWKFSTRENRDAFAAAPQKFAPQYGGYCAWAVAQDSTAGIDPEAWAHRRRQALPQLFEEHSGPVGQRHPRQHRQGRRQLAEDRRQSRQIGPARGGDTTIEKDRFMLIKSRRPSDVKSFEITPKSVFMDRRRFMMTAAAGVGLASVSLPGGARAAKLEGVVKGPYGTDEERTPFEDVTRYNNFYELGTGKGDPAKNAASLKTRPWSVAVGGEVAKPGTYDFDDLIKPHMLEERVYRLRCVEAWSMVIPWVGFPLADVIKRLEPTSKAEYVAFQTLYDPEQMPGQRRAVIDWPYVEGLRLDEAMHPLAILAVGMYGEMMPNQNGAPIRLVVPWKYGFKSIKSIVRMDLVEHMRPPPGTSRHHANTGSIPTSIPRSTIRAGASERNGASAISCAARP